MTASVEYLTVRRNIAALLDGRPDVAGRPVPATPGWTVRDLLAHLTGIARRVAAELSGQTADEFPVDTASVPELISAWERAGRVVDARLAGTDARRGRVLTMDAFTHEFDLRCAVDAAWPHEHPAFAGALDLVVSGFTAAVRKLGLPAILVESAGRQWLAGDGEAAARLRGHHHDVYRSLAGRRTYEQITHLGWSTDPAPWLPAFRWGPFRPPGNPVEECAGISQLARSAGAIVARRRGRLAC